MTALGFDILIPPQISQKIKNNHSGCPILRGSLCAEGGLIAPDQKVLKKQKAQPNGRAFKTSLLNSEYQTAINQMHVPAILFNLESATCKITLLTNVFHRPLSLTSNPILDLFPFVF
jgi:hypothetical protein